MRKFLKLMVCVILFTFAIGSKSYSQSFNWNRVIDAIAIVESNNNPKAVGNSSVGLLQITPILVKDCNKILEKQNKSKRYNLNDRLSPKKSKEMFIIIQEYYNPQHNIERAIRLWNGGPNYSIKGTQIYYNKVRKHLA